MNAKDQPKFSIRRNGIGKIVKIRHVSVGRERNKIKVILIHILKSTLLVNWKIINNMKLKSQKSLLTCIVLSEHPPRVYEA